MYKYSALIICTIINRNISYSDLNHTLSLRQVHIREEEEEGENFPPVKFSDTSLVLVHPVDRRNHTHSHTHSHSHTQSQSHTVTHTQSPPHTHTHTHSLPIPAPAAPTGSLHYSVDVPPTTFPKSSEMETASKEAAEK